MIYKLFYSIGIIYMSIIDMFKSMSYDSKTGFLDGARHEFNDEYEFDYASDEIIDTDTKNDDFEEFDDPDI